MSHLLQFYFDNRDRILLHESDTYHLTCTTLTKNFQRTQNPYRTVFDIKGKIILTITIMRLSLKRKKPISNSGQRFRYRYL